MKRGSRRHGRLDYADIQVSRHEKVRPEPDILDALERDYPIEASIADLVDNSIDAGARKVLIRFMQSGRRLVSLCIADNGQGVVDASKAMQFAARRKYRKSDIGMFGVGLKTASLSQADSVIIASRRRGGSPVGRRWTKAGIKKFDWQLDVLSGESAASILRHRWGVLGSISTGTVVRWDRVDDFERLQSGVEEYLEDRILRIRQHLGLKLHRFLSRNAIRIFIDVEDLESGEVGPQSSVEPLDPFPPKGSGAPGYPRDFVVEFPKAGKVRMRAHIWRKKSREEGYKLGGGSVAEHQGFYFFRHDRLIQDGGWCGIIPTNDPHMSLARIQVDIPDHLASYLKVRSNKAGVDVPPSFGPSVHAARAKGGMTFQDYLKRADEVYRKRGEQKSRPMLNPGDGIPADVRRALEKCSMRFVRGQKCSIAWERLGGMQFVHVDQDERRIVLNSRYRQMLLRGEHGGKTDLPLIRTLLFFVFESLLAGARIGPVERFRLNAIQASMKAALKLEKEWAAE